MTNERMECCVIGTVRWATQVFQEIDESKNAKADDLVSSLSQGSATRCITRTVPGRKVSNLRSQGPFAPLQRWRCLLVVTRDQQNDLVFNSIP